MRRVSRTKKRVEVHAIVVLPAGGGGAAGAAGGVEERRKRRTYTDINQAPYS